ncbi:Cysteine-rich protein [Spironucleus salmonicida]|uniref:Cysteine-rich protein n=1 Tax=Spironucleus salmonicida TaxID=348837 RepID=V6LK05_9EUKA|nr:Cysteine-rich protein [Spironucleus salmonicida]|eukprot:EST44066.1 Cysteine-rich protein [Spironucleus salmonicida]
MRIIYIEDYCVHCGACVRACEPGAIEQDPITKQVKFDKKYLCVNCCQCIYACRFNSMKIGDAYELQTDI